MVAAALAKKECRKKKNTLQIHIIMYVYMYVQHYFPMRLSFTLHYFLHHSSILHYRCYHSKTIVIIASVGSPFLSEALDIKAPASDQIHSAATLKFPS
jgi:hypothetical protein